MKLRFSEKLFYGAGAASSIAELAITFFLLFYYTRIVQLDPALFGLALMIGRFWDAITDPIMGYLSDQTRTRWGRRRPFLAAGALPFGLAFVLVWAPFAGIHGNAAFGYLLGSFLLYSTALTVCQVPYFTLGGELSEDYHERASLIGFRQIFMLLSLLGVVVGLPLLVDRFSGSPYQDAASRDGWIAVVVLFAFVGVVAWLATAFGARDRAKPGPRSSIGALASVAGVFRASAKALRNRDFRVVAAVFLVVQISFATATSVLPFLLTDWMGEADLLPAMMGTLFALTIPFLAIWVRLARRLGKRGSYRAGLFLMGAVCLASFGLLQPDIPRIFWFVYPVVFGIGLASHLVFPWSLVPDAIDLDELESGERNDGSYFGVMTFLSKSSSAVSAQVAGLLLSLIGYDATLPVQSADTVMGLRLIFAVIPGAAFLAGWLVLGRLSMTEGQSREVRRKLERRRLAEA